jgi:hypothetical protein
MIIDISKFGTMLLSRPAGREAFLSARAYLVPKEKKDEIIELDFSQVKVLTPSWADEFVRGFEEEYGKEKIKIIEGNNLSVKTTFETLGAVS